MLTIRDEQLQIFQQEAERRFHREVMEHVRREVPEIAGPLPEARFARMVDFGLSKADRYGLRDEDNILTFVTLMFAVAPNFDEYLWFQILLADIRLEPDRRFEVLLLEATEEDWNEAAEMDDGSWGLPALAAGGR